ncbi:MAG: ABC transporter substrate-binding protein, partial [Myxococcota bacterium]
MLALLSCLLVVLGCSPDPYPGEVGEILHVSLRTLPKTLDPARVEDESSGKLTANVFEGLVAYHPYARPYEVQPAVAEALPEVSEDGLTYTFTLRDDVRFHDDPCFPGGEGREVVARDFVYAMKRFAHPATQARSLWMFRDHIRGLEAYRDAISDRMAAERQAGRLPGSLFALDEVPLEGVEAVDDRTLRLHLAGPYPQRMWVLAMPAASVYPRECVEYYGDEWRNHPVGSGPFRVVEYNPVYRAVMVKHEGYREARVPDPRNHPAERYPDWEADEAAGRLARAGQRIPFVDGIEYRFIQEDQPRWLYFKNGHTDFVNPPKDNVAEALPRGELSPDLEARGVHQQRWVELGTVYACINTEDEVMRNVDVRRAIALAYDHKWTVDNLYGGMAVVAHSVVPPGVAGHDPDYRPFHAEDGRARYELAKEYLAKAGYPDGIDPATGERLHLTFQNSGGSVTQRLFASRFVDEMRRIGIEVDVVVNTFPQLIQKMRNKQFQITSLAWGFDYPDAQNILQLLYGPNKAPGVGSANFVNAEFDALYDAASVLPDSPQRTALYQQMTRIVSDQVPWVTRAHRIRPHLAHAWLHGYKYTEVNDQHLRYVWVDSAEREAALAEWNRPVRWPLVLFGLVTVVLVA